VKILLEETQEQARSLEQNCKANTTNDVPTERIMIENRDQGHIDYAEDYVDLLSSDDEEYYEINEFNPDLFGLLGIDPNSFFKFPSHQHLAEEESDEEEDLFDSSDDEYVWDYELDEDEVVAQDHSSGGEGDGILGRLLAPLVNFFPSSSSGTSSTPPQPRLRSTTTRHAFSRLHTHTHTQTRPTTLSGQVATQHAALAVNSQHTSGTTGAFPHISQRTQGQS